jgi:Cu/Ag efflux pump CusA
MAFLLSLAFGSTRDAALVMVNLPLALMGGVAGAFLSGGVLSVASLIGFITVFAQCISICRWLQLIHKGRLAPLENAPVSTPWA